MSMNRVELLGNLGAEVALRFTGGGTAVADLRLATSRSWTDAAGNKQTDTQWHRVVVWGKQAENCQKYLSKGRQILVEGRLQTRKWEDKDGNKRYTTEVVAQRIEFLGGGKKQETTDEVPPPPVDNDEVDSEMADVPVVSSTDHRDIQF